MEISISLDPSIPKELQGYLTEVNKLKDISIHCDVMDGYFVPREAVNMLDFTFIIKNAEHPVDVHFMIENPSEGIGKFIGEENSTNQVSGFEKDILSKIRSVTFHAEAVTVTEGQELFAKLKNRNLQVGVAFDLETEITEKHTELVQLCDVVTLMSVKAGKSGQTFNPNALLKIAKIKNINQNCRIIMDGGINADNIAFVKLGGVDTAVIGSAIYKAENRQNFIDSLKV